MKVRDSYKENNLIINKFTHLFYYYPNNIDFSGDEIEKIGYPLLNLEQTFTNLLEYLSKYSTSVIKSSNYDGVYDGFIVDYTNKIIIQLSPFVHDCTIYYKDYCYPKEEIFEILKKDIKIQKRKSSIQLIKFDKNGDIDVRDFEIKNTILNISELYNDDFQKQHENLENFINGDKSGLVILHGMKGTGKKKIIFINIWNIQKFLLSL